MHKSGRRGPPPPSPTELDLEQACTSIDNACSILSQAAESLSQAAAHVGAAAASPEEVAKVAPRQTQRNIPIEDPTCPNSGLSAPPSKLLNVRLTTKRPRRQLGPVASPHFALPALTAGATKNIAPKTSPFFPAACVDPFSHIPTSAGLAFDLRPPHFGLIQERICNDLFALVVQAILWNKTRGAVARPILWNLLCKYPHAAALACAEHRDVEAVIATLGLHRTRAKRLIDMASAWVAAPPCPGRRYGRRDYPRKGDGRDVRTREFLGPDDDREGWEIAHLPGVGEYALDSYRIFGRDRLRGLGGEADIEPEWKRLVPRDKELGPYVRWKWAGEGWDFDLVTGARKPILSTASEHPSAPSPPSHDCMVAER